MEEGKRGSNGRRSSVRGITPKLLSEFIQVLKDHRIKKAKIEGVGEFDFEADALIDPEQLEEYNKAISRITGGDNPDDLLFASADT